MRYEFFTDDEVGLMVFDSALAAGYAGETAHHKLGKL